VAWVWVWVWAWMWVCVLLVLWACFSRVVSWLHRLHLDVQVGDPQQQQPSVHSGLSQRCGLGVSVLERMYHLGVYSDEKTTATRCKCVCVVQRLAFGFFCCCSRVVTRYCSFPGFFCRTTTGATVTLFGLPLRFTRTPSHPSGEWRALLVLCCDSVAAVAVSGSTCC